MKKILCVKMLKNNPEYFDLIKDYSTVMFVHVNETRLYPIRIPAKYLKNQSCVASDGCYPADYTDIQIINLTKLAKILYD